MYAELPIFRRGWTLFYSCGNQTSCKPLFDCRRNKPNYAEMRKNEKEKDKKIETSYKEIMIGKTLYRVTSVFTGEKDLGKTLEQLAVRRAMAELMPNASGH